MKVTVELSDQEMAEILELTGKRRKGPAIRRLMEEALRQRRRAQIAQRLLSGEWGVELETYEADQERERGRAQEVACGPKCFWCAANHRVHTAMTARLEDLKPDARVRGLVGRGAVRIITAQMMAELEIVCGGRSWRLKRALANSIGCPESTTLRSLNAHA